MDLDEYQQKARLTAKYPNVGNNLWYPALGLNGEAGEVAEKVKKIYRDKEGKFTVWDANEIAKELGDVLWYIAGIASELGVTLNNIAHMNIGKLQSRASRNTLHGDGDNR
jgi:NTP pyrophosphatase (non-canonical NTP hydrolase)